MILNPLKSLLYSRKFVTAVLTLVFNLVVVFVPELEHVAQEIMVLTVTLWLGLAAGISYEDAAEKGREISIEPRMDNKDAIRQILDEVLIGFDDESNEA